MVVQTIFKMRMYNLYSYLHYICIYYFMCCYVPEYIRYDLGITFPDNSGECIISFTVLNALRAIWGTSTSNNISVFIKQLLSSF